MLSVEDLLCLGTPGCVSPFEKCVDRRARLEFVPLTELSVKGYRSIRDLSIAGKRVNVLLGPNGCGKTNLYKSLHLVWAAASGRLARTVADEGGMASMQWAGPQSKGPVRVTVSVKVDAFDYTLSIGLSQNELLTPFLLDPHIKEEKLAVNGVTMLERGHTGGFARNREGVRDVFAAEFDPSQSVLVQLVNVHDYPHLSQFRRLVEGWRFYHQFRTDQDSPLRSPQVGIRTPVLAHDGIDLAAALMTIKESANDAALHSAIESAFPGSGLMIRSGDGVFEVQMAQPGIHRPLNAKELSDGTLRYLCLVAALMSPSPAPLLALNEPETSLHPEMIEPLAKLIARAADVSQIWITTHSKELALRLAELTVCKPRELVKEGGETRIAGRPTTSYYAEE